MRTIFASAVSLRMHVHEPVLLFSVCENGFFRRGYTGVGSKRKAVHERLVIRRPCQRYRKAHRLLWGLYDAAGSVKAIMKLTEYCFTSSSSLST